MYPLAEEGGFAVSFIDDGEHTEAVFPFDSAGIEYVEG